MATASETVSTSQVLSDREFEELLQKTWEFVQTKKIKVLHPFESNAESTSWT
jgi:hypothetical protein